MLQLIDFQKIVTIIICKSSVCASKTTLVIGKNYYVCFYSGKLQDLVSSVLDDSVFKQSLQKRDAKKSI
jgi:hypothetical protein